MQFQILNRAGKNVQLSIQGTAPADSGNLRDGCFNLEGFGLKYHVFTEVYMIKLSTANVTVELLNQFSERYLCISCSVRGTLTSENSSGEVNYFELDSGNYNLYYPSPVLSNIRLSRDFEGFIFMVPEGYIQSRLKGAEGIAAYISDHISERRPFITSALRLQFNIFQLFEEGLLPDTQNKDVLRLYLEARTLEIMAVIINQLENQCQTSEKPTFLKANDIEKIYQAKQYIEKHLRNPCSLIELSRLVGLNDFKLKKGFREVMGTTVFGYLFNCRMQTASQLLLQKKSVSEVSFLVGYKNPHHFTAAYKKKYGVLPSSVNR